MTIIILEESFEMMNHRIVLGSAFATVITEERLLLFFLHHFEMYHLYLPSFWNNFRFSFIASILYLS